jgi:hypothetical protein
MQPSSERPGPTAGYGETGRGMILRGIQPRSGVMSIRNQAHRHTRPRLPGILRRHTRSILRRKSGIRQRQVRD